MERLAAARRGGLGTLLTLAAVALAAALPARAAADDGPYPGNGGWRPGPERYAMDEQRTRVRMSDGITLAATVVRPVDRATGRPAPGPFPVVLAATPYSKDVPLASGFDLGPGTFVPRGYVYVLLDVRGTGGSGGSFELFGAREVRDYVEAVDWAARLDGTTGEVGMVGVSYLGVNQLFAAGAVGRGSPLKAIFPINVPIDLYRDLTVPGGMFNNLFDTPYAATQLALFSLGPAFSGQDIPQAGQDLGQHWTGSADIHGRTMADALSGGDRAYDGAFYRTRSIARALARIPRNGVAVFVHNSWFDIWQRGDSLVYGALQQAARRGARRGRARRRGPDPRYQALIGPYTHAYVSERMRHLALEWFDTWLKRARTGMARTRTPLHLYEVGGGRWVEATSWPPRGARAREWHLAPGRTGTAPNALNDGTLAGEPPSAGSDEIPYYHGFNVPCSRATDQELLFGPVKAFGDMYGNRWENPCTYDDRGFETGALTYTTEPLERPLTIAGPGNVTLHASSTTPNASWVVVLSDVSPDGRARPLATGSLLGSHRALDRGRSLALGGKLLLPWHPYTRAAERPVPVGRRVRYDVDLPGIVARIAAGHRIRLTVQTSYRPYLEPTFPHQQQLFGGSYRVALGGAEPSRLTLAVAAPERLPTSRVGWGPCTTDCGPGGG